MDATGPANAVAVSHERERTMQGAAREVLRGWLRTRDGDGGRALGRRAIADSADAIARLSRMDGIGGADRVLAEVGALAETLFPAPAPPRRWWQAARDPAPAAPTPERFAPLIDRLGDERDATMRRLIVLRTDRARLAESDGALEDAVHLIRALAPAIEAAARELGGEDPARAAALRSDGAAVLVEREHAVLTQLAVHRQARMTIDLLIANHETLDAALEQARTATLSALQVAVAARRATAARGATGDDDALRPDRVAAMRALDAALVQARTALVTLDGAPSGER